LISKERSLKHYTLSFTLFKSPLASLPAYRQAGVNGEGEIFLEEDKRNGKMLNT
jgi:hypothetical protein